MFKRILFLMVLGLAGALSAGDVAATLLKISGEGHLYLPDGSEGVFKAGTLVQPGSRILTSEGGLAVLMMDDGSRVSLGPNTDLTLSESKADAGVRSTVFDMVKGLFKATVEKLTVGSRFQVKTADAVAAVKGTNFAVLLSDKGTEAQVDEGTVWLENKRGERAVVTRRRAALARRDGHMGKVRRMTRREVRNFARWALTSVPGSATGEHERGRGFWARLRPEQQRKLINAFREGLGQEAWDDITKLRAEERQERWKNRLRASDERGLAAEESRVDFALRKATLDRHGNRVRFEEYLLRPRADRLQFLNYTRREGKTDFLSSVNTYNQNLPRNLGLVSGLNQKAWDTVLAPRYWVVNEYQVLGNSLGDSFASEIKFFDPVHVSLSRWELPIATRQVAMNLSDLSNINSGENLEYWMRGTSAGGPGSVVGTTGSIAGSTTPGINGQGSINYATASTSELMWKSNDTVVTGISPYEPTFRVLSLSDLGAQLGDFAGGVEISYKDGSGNPYRTIQYRSYAIDENGTVLNLKSLLNQSPLDAVSTYAFRSLQEIEVSSNGFHGDIDVVSKLLRLYDVSKHKDSL